MGKAIDNLVVQLTWTDRARAASARAREEMEKGTHQVPSPNPWAPGMVGAENPKSKYEKVRGNANEAGLSADYASDKAMSPTRGSKEAHRDAMFKHMDAQRLHETAASLAPDPKSRGAHIDAAAHHEFMKHYHNQETEEPVQPTPDPRYAQSALTPKRLENGH